MKSFLRLALALGVFLLGSSILSATSVPLSGNGGAAGPTLAWPVSGASAAGATAGPFNVAGACSWGIYVNSTAGSSTTVLVEITSDQTLTVGPWYTVASFSNPAAPDTFSNVSTIPISGARTTGVRVRIFSDYVSGTIVGSIETFFDCKQ